MTSNRITPILTIVVPAYNMERYLAQNLNSYCKHSFSGQIEVLVLDNSSTDATADIAMKYQGSFPDIFKVVCKENNGYGSSVNLAIQMAQGKYFKIVDADDWVDTEELVKLLICLEHSSADLVQTNYSLFDISTNKLTTVNVKPKCIEDGRVYTDFSLLKKIFPCLHSTTIKTEILQKNKIQLLHNTFYVDEALSIYSVALSQTVVYYNLNLYRYRIGNPEQSVSITNMAARYLDRERVIKDYLQIYQELIMNGKTFNLCSEQISRNIGSHFTTLYIYISPSEKGRFLANEWLKYVKKFANAYYRRVIFKRWILFFINILKFNVNQYLKLKRFLQGKV